MGVVNNRLPLCAAEVTRVYGDPGNPQAVVRDAKQPRRHEQRLTTAVVQGQAVDRTGYLDQPDWAWPAAHHGRVERAHDLQRMAARWGTASGRRARGRRQPVEGLP